MTTADETPAIGTVDRPRNFSPWYSWMLKLAATRRADPLPVDDLTGELDAWRDRRAGAARRAARTPRPSRCRWPSRPPSRWSSMPAPASAPPTVAIASCSTPRRRCRCRPTCWCRSIASNPARPCWPSTATAPASRTPAGSPEDETPNGDYAHQLARRGYVVLAPDLRCFGERADWNPPDHYGCDTNLVHAVMAGESPLGSNLWDLARCLDVLADHPLVDPSRLGAVGLSYGGTCTLFLAAVDARVRAAVVSGYFSSWAEAHKMPWNMCGSQVLAGMLGQLEHVDLGALVAPRPLLVETGTEDLIFPLDRGAPVDGRAGPRLRAPRRARRCSSTTCSRVTTSGTASGPTTSSTSGSETATEERIRLATPSPARPRPPGRGAA